MNKYIHVRELIFRLSRDVSLGRQSSNPLIASATTTSRNITLILTRSKGGYGKQSSRDLYFVTDEEIRF